MQQGLLRFQASMKKALTSINTEFANHLNNADPHEAFLVIERKKLLESKEDVISTEDKYTPSASVSNNKNEVKIEK